MQRSCRAGCGRPTQVPAGSQSQLPPPRIAPGPARSGGQSSLKHHVLPPDSRVISALRAEPAGRRSASPPIPALSTRPAMQLPPSFTCVMAILSSFPCHSPCQALSTRPGLAALRESPPPRPSSHPLRYIYFQAPASPGGDLSIYYVHTLQHITFPCISLPLLGFLH